MTLSTRNTTTARKRTNPGSYRGPETRRVNERGSSRLQDDEAAMQMESISDYSIAVGSDSDIDS
jgi:hypothetical protein